MSVLPSAGCVTVLLGIVTLYSGQLMIQNDSQANELKERRSKSTHIPCRSPIEALSIIMKSITVPPNE